MEILEIVRVTEEITRAVGRLARQLAPEGAAPASDWISEIVATPGCRLLVAQERPNGWILGMVTVVSYRIPTGRRAWIEDVVVDVEARGRGVGEALVRRALACARELGAREVDLTSASQRAAANRLYPRIGFWRRETNVYRWSCPQTGVPPR